MPSTPVLDHAALLDELAVMGMELARAIHASALPSPEPAQVVAFERVARSVRRTVLLARRLAEGPGPGVWRREARARVIREVEDAIHREHGDGEHADALRDELAERLDSPELDEVLGETLTVPGNRSVVGGRALEGVIADIRRDLGLDAAPGTRPWRRRGPGAVRVLRERAAAVSGVRAAGPGWPGRGRDSPGG